MLNEIFMDSLFEKNTFYVLYFTIVCYSLLYYVTLFKEFFLLKTSLDILNCFHFTHT